ncbi:MAG: ECF-type sigma factor [Bryobacteraceae bacterium]
MTPYLMAASGRRPIASPPEGVLLELVYGELHRLASSFMRQERPGNPLQASALVNEAYLRLQSANLNFFEDRHHFFRVASRAMRQVLIDHARRRYAQKRARGQRITLDDTGTRIDDVLTLDSALEKLAEIDPRQAEVVELRSFGGLSVAETAAVLGVSAEDVNRGWAVARAWLRGERENSASVC